MRTGILNTVKIVWYGLFSEGGFGALLELSTILDQSLTQSSS